MAVAGDDPNDIFAEMMLKEGLTLHPPDVEIPASELPAMTNLELMALHDTVCDDLVNSDELLEPRSEWAADTHNLKYAIEQELKRRNLR